jgi:hypothetical protein
MGGRFFSGQGSQRLAGRQSPHTDDDGLRRCSFCDRQLPATSRPERRFCSTSCRVRSWHEANPGPAEGVAHPRTRLHWHLGGTSLLTGDITAGRWYGPEGCPPECPGITAPYTTSHAVIEGREWAAPSSSGEREATAACLLPGRSMKNRGA